MQSERPVLVDSHAHLDTAEFDADREAVIEEARQSGVAFILVPAELTEQRSLDIALGLPPRHPEIFVAAGVHPHHAKNFGPEHLERLQELAEGRRIVAVGEVGLDFHYSFSPPDSQREALRHQASRAQELHLPLIIHTRMAGHEAADILESAGFSGQGVFHCYTEDWPLAERMLARGFYISFSGILTFPKAQALREVAEKVPLGRLLVETDSPYLVPAARRGSVRRNEPALVAEVAKVLAEVKAVPLDELAEVTTRNFRLLFNV